MNERTGGNHSRRFLFSEYINMMLTVPDEIAGKPVTAVADGAFSDCKYIADLTLPERTLLSR